MARKPRIEFSGFAQEVIKVADAQAGDFEYRNAGIEDVVKMVAERMNIRKNMIESVTRERVAARARGMVVYICRTVCGKKTKEVCRYFGRGESILSEMMRDIELDLAENGSGLYKLVQQTIAGIKKNNRPCSVREIK
ncbi:MAG: hypothetical protein COX62_04905 [Deltaproteobacteria bacterium CG_4_10_14_0_2_um_filter_43_8]|nr:MAG: hypothetical protein COX62_04905 [Deltaproteobacteria bacterium CG_4_10_14_0_2_um_filter_43_8]